MCFARTESDEFAWRNCLKQMIDVRDKSDVFDRKSVLTWTSDKRIDVVFFLSVVSVDETLHGNNVFQCDGSVDLGNEWIGLEC